MKPAVQDALSDSLRPSHFPTKWKNTSTDRFAGPLVNKQPRFTMASQPGVQVDGYLYDIPETHSHNSMIRSHSSIYKRVLKVFDDDHKTMVFWGHSVSFGNHAGTTIDRKRMCVRLYPRSSMTATYLSCPNSFSKGNCNKVWFHLSGFHLLFHLYFHRNNNAPSNMLVYIQVFMFCFVFYSHIAAWNYISKQKKRGKTEQTHIPKTGDIWTVY